MTENEVRRIVAETVAETLIRLGIDPLDPKETQADMQHLRSWRKSTDTVKKQALVTAVGILTAGFLGMVYAVFSRGN